MSNRENDTTEQFENICHGNVLIMTHGLPRSGKSTWARVQGIPIVNPDAIRLSKTGQRWWGPIEHEVWATAITMIRALFWAGHKVVILDDVTNTRQKRDLFLSSRDVQWRRFVKRFDTSASECCRRAQESYPVLVAVINWMVENWEPIEPNEGIEAWLNHNESM